VKYRKDGDVEAAHRLVTSNLRFVVKVAHEYSSYGMRMSDLIQEGNIGLMTAVKKFDPEQGLPPDLLCRLVDPRDDPELHPESWSLVKIGTTQAQRKLFYKLSQTKRTLARFLGGGDKDHLDEASRDIVAKTLHVSGEDVEEMDARMRGRDASLDSPSARGTGQTTALGPSGPPPTTRRNRSPSPRRIPGFGRDQGGPEVVEREGALHRRKAPDDRRASDAPRDRRPLPYLPRARAPARGAGQNQDPDGPLESGLSKELH
jgi:hypothetical protein